MLECYINFDDMNNDNNKDEKTYSSYKCWQLVLFDGPS